MTAEKLEVAKRVEVLERDLQRKTLEYDEVAQALSKEKDDHEASKQALYVQKTSIQALGQKFNSDFQHMATKILGELESQQKAKQVDA